MHTLKLVYLTILHLFEQVWLVLKSIPASYRYWLQQAVRDEMEAERLDRLRNPSKYLGR
jgi:hypothetical protein